LFRESSVSGCAGSTARCLRIKIKVNIKAGLSLIPHTQRAASIQDLVSWVLAANFPVTALSATRMWREETNYGPLSDLWTAEAVYVPVAGVMFSLIERNKLFQDIIDGSVW
jgi:hypothetical protein